MSLHGWRLFSLLAAALVGGYALATAMGIFLAAALPLPRAESVLIANMLSFAAYAGTVIWVFTLRRPALAWLVLSLLSTLLLAIALPLTGSTL